jgi:hypothetical protein
MRIAILALLCAATLVLAGGCSNEPDCNDITISRVDPGTDFSMIQTFAVLAEPDYPDDLPEDLPADTETSLAAANDAVRSQLIARGLSEVASSADPDVVVFSLAVTESSNGVVWECVPGYLWGFWGFFWDSCAWLEPVVVTYGTGTVVVGLADPTEEKAVFGGVIQGVLGCGDAPADRVVRGVNEIFLDYPVPPLPAPTP